ncbi:MAG TPA: TIGR00341 family protein [Ignavibacteria bacterium]|nr:TIGR00341 family protein [Ignavibacteria bacterium]
MTFLHDLFNLNKGEDDKDKTLESVKNNISFTGANFWILACAIMVASIGLNINSTAVIIGAMLISPLMGPIVGSGFALGIYDFPLLRTSIRNLLIATFVGLLVSTLYFVVSPFKEAQSEILMRTSPNIYDVMIAFFGGLVGVIAVTRLEKGNPIPGVAIATALMPPLCTAGYGIAIGNYRFFFGSLFLYSINCVFICIATFAIVKYLKYPSKKIDENKRKQVKYGITAIVLLMLIPSIFFAYSLYEQQKFLQSVNDFINEEFTLEGNTVIYKKTSYSSTPKTIEIAFLSKVNKSTIDSAESKLPEYGLPNTKLLILQDSTDNIQKLKSDILNEVKASEVKVNEKEAKIKQLEDEIAKNTFDNQQILNEVNSIYPDINSISISNHSFFKENDSANFVIPVLIYNSEKALKTEDQEKLRNWLRQRLKTDSVQVYKEN